MFYGVARDITQLIEARQRASANERMMLEAQKLAKMGSWSLDLSSEKLTRSEPLYSFFETDVESFILTKESFVNLVDKDYRKLLVENAKTARENGLPFRNEYSFTSKSGKKKFIEEFGYSDIYENGDVINIYGTAQDITESKQVEMLLQASEKRFKALVENSTDAIAIIGVDGNPSYLSPAIINTLGYSEKEAMQLNLFEIVHPYDIPTMAFKFDEVLKFPGTPVKAHISRVRHKNGSWRWLDATITNILHEPAINGIIDNFRDITEQIEKDLALTRNEKRFKAMVQEGADLTAILDMNAVFKYISPNYPTILGYSEDDLLGESGFVHFHPDDLKTIQNEFARLMTEQRVKSPPYRYKRKDVSWCWLQSVGTNLLEEEAIRGIVINTVDVTDLINAQEVLQQSNERYHLVNQATNDGIYEWDLKNDLFTWGDGFFRNFGYQKSDKAFRLSGWINLTYPIDVEKKQRCLGFFFTESSGIKVE